MPYSQTMSRFTYAAQKGAYLSTIGALLFLSLAEGSLVVFLVFRFIPGVSLQTLILALIGLLLALMFGKLLFPLWTHHRVSATTLELRYGLDFHASIPLSAIVSARPLQERIGPIPRLYYDARKRYFSLAFSRTGQVLLRLESPRTFHFGLRGVCSTEQLLISVDQREAFLNLLSPSKAIQPATAHRPLSTNFANSSQATTEQVDSTNAQSSSYMQATPHSNSDQTTTSFALRAIDLTRRYADIIAVERLNLAVSQGEIYGFLGPNGAGKSTAIKMLVGLLQPTAGHVWLAGHDVWRAPLLAKEALGYVADRALLYDRLTGREFLTFLAQLRGMSRELADQRISELLKTFELTGQAERVCGLYSFGMKRKLSLAGALLHRPPVLILDEPLNGLDPLSSHRLKELFLHLAAEGTTIFLSTHDLATAEAICHRVGIIQRGRLLAEGSAAQLRALASAPNLESVFLALTTQREEATL